MDFGYVRVSTKEQNPDRQIKKLLELGIDQRNIYVEKKSGHTFCREVYDMLVNHVMREGDRLTVTELKRFGRNYVEISRMAAHYKRAAHGHPGSRYADLRHIQGQEPNGTSDIGCGAGTTIICGRE